MTEIDWNNPASLYIVVCRPALPKDTTDVMELTRTIWDGHDYIPHVWNDWLADPEGLLAVAEYGGQVIGLGKLTRLTEDEWWLEGLRVHPDHQGKGVASRLMEYLHDTWEKNAGGTIRLATACYRLSVQHLSDRLGFHKIGEFSEFSAPAIPNEVTFEELGFSPIQLGQELEAAQFARQSPAVQFSCGLMDSGYQWASPVPARVVEAVEREQAWWWRNNQGMVLFRDWRDDQDQIMLKITLLACQLTDLPAILEDVRHLTAVSSYARLQWVASLHPELQLIIKASGFQRDWEDSVFLYEKTRTN